jgi:hypothetical protein
LGLFEATHRLLAACQELERNGPNRSRQITEFNLLFQFAFRCVLRELTQRTMEWPETKDDPRRMAEAVNEVVTRFGQLWNRHTRQVRLSELERFSDTGEWTQMVAFIKEYGRILFTQGFLNPSNLRMILQQGVGEWLKRIMARDNDSIEWEPLVKPLHNATEFRRIEQHLEFVITAVLENYDAYKEYNSTTTQSDYGENLHGLLELLRVKVSYERHRWTLQPLYMAHRELTNTNKLEAAEFIREVLIGESQSMADDLEHLLAKTETKVGYKLAIVSEAVHERFLRPLQLDRLLSLIPRCWADRGNENCDALPILKQELEDFREAVPGGGIDTPDWVRDLERELERVREGASDLDVVPLAARQPLDYLAFTRQLDDY